VKDHVAIDLDDVCLDFFGNVLDCFYREYGERVEWDGDPWGPDAVAFTKHPKLLATGYKSWWDWLRDRDWLWGIAPAVPGAVGGVGILRNAGFYVECVTSKPKWAEPQVWRWLGKWRVPFSRVTVVEVGAPKTEFTDAQWIIDDKRETCALFCKDRDGAVLFDRSQTETLPPGKLRIAHNWDDVVREMEVLRGR
jgi:hypothetical protein